MVLRERGLPEIMLFLARNGPARLRRDSLVAVELPSGAGSATDLLLIPIAGLVAYLLPRLRRRKGLWYRVAEGFLGLLMLCVLSGAVAVYPALLSARREAVVAEAHTRVRQLAAALEAYALENGGQFPPPDTWATTLVNETGLIRKCLFLPVPLGGGEKSGLIDIDFQYSRRRHRLTDTPDFRVLWTKEPVDVSGEPDYMDKIGRFVIHTDCSWEYVPEAAF